MGRVSHREVFMSKRTDRLRSGRMDDFGNHTFALCLTHDVDRPYKTVQAPYQAIKERDYGHLKSLFTGDRPYWCFEKIMEIERAFDVRSSFYFLNEKRVVDMPRIRQLNPFNWLQFTGHYSINDPAITWIMRELATSGWEVGIHGSYESYNDQDRFAWEKSILEDCLGQQVIGGRQHFLNLDRPDSWRVHRDCGLKYDASLGSSTEYGFTHGYDVKRPFNDDFLVFPLTIMEVALVQGEQSIKTAKQEVDRIIEEAARHGAIMTVLWHVRLFNEQEFPGYQTLYRYLISRAKEAGAWIGPISDACVAMTDENVESTVKTKNRVQRVGGEATGRP